MSVAQFCDVCGTVVGKDVEGFGMKAGFKNFGFDLCTECMERVETFFLDDLKVGELNEVTLEPSNTVGTNALAERANALED